MLENIIEVRILANVFTYEKTLILPLPASCPNLIKVFYVSVAR